MSNDATPFTAREQDNVIRMLRAVDKIYARVFHSIDVRSPCRLPRKGPAILVCNHTSALDPVLIQSVAPRLIRWMMAKEYFDNPFLRGIFKSVGVILVERSGRDMAATRAAMRALEDGYVLGVFPEGTIETTPDLRPFQAGIGMLALKTGAPVFPAYLDGTQRGKDMVQPFFISCHASLAFGHPLLWDGQRHSRKEIETATNQIFQAVKQLKTAYPQRVTPQCRGALGNNP